MGITAADQTPRFTIAPVPRGAAVVGSADGFVKRRSKHLDVGLARLAEAAAGAQAPIDELFASFSST